MLIGEWQQATSRPSNPPGRSIVTGPAPTSLFECFLRTFGFFAPAGSGARRGGRRSATGSCTRCLRAGGAGRLWMQGSGGSRSASGALVRPPGGSAAERASCSSSVSAHASASSAPPSTAAWPALRLRAVVRGARWHGSPCCRPAAQMLVMEPLDTDCDAPNWYFRKVLMVACDAPRLCMRQTTWRRRGLISFPGMPSAPAERGQDAREAPTRPGETRFCAAMFFPQRYFRDTRLPGLQREPTLCGLSTGAVAVYSKYIYMRRTATKMIRLHSHTVKLALKAQPDGGVP